MSPLLALVSGMVHVPAHADRVVVASGRTTVVASAGSSRTAVVVGAGVGGLYTAARLAREGVDVTLVEKNSRAAAGGRLACETVTAPNGRAYRFETGPSLLLLPSVYQEALHSLGLNPDAHLELARCMPSYAVHVCHVPTRTLRARLPTR